MYSTEDWLFRLFPAHHSLVQEQKACVTQLLNYPALTPLIYLDEIGWRILNALLRERFKVERDMKWDDSISTVQLTIDYLGAGKIGEIEASKLWSCLFRWPIVMRGYRRNSLAEQILAATQFCWSSESPGMYRGYEEGLAQVKEAVQKQGKMVIDPIRGDWYLSTCYTNNSLPDRMVFAWLRQYSQTTRIYLEVCDSCLYVVVPYRPDKLSRGVSVMILVLNLFTNNAKKLYYQLFIPWQWGQGQRDRRLMTWARRIRGAQYDAVQTVIIPDLAQIVLSYLGDEKAPAEWGFTGSAAYYAHS